MSGGAGLASSAPGKYAPLSAGSGPRMAGRKGTFFGEMKVTSQAGLHTALGVHFITVVCSHYSGLFENETSKKGKWATRQTQVRGATSQIHFLCKTAKKS